MKRIRGLALPPGLRPTSMAPCHVPEHVVIASENDTFEALGRWPPALLSSGWSLGSGSLLSHRLTSPKRTPSIILSPHMSPPLFVSLLAEIIPQREQEMKLTATG